MVTFYRIENTDYYMIGSREMPASGYMKTWNNDKTKMGIMHSGSYKELTPPITYDKYLKENGDPYSSFTELLDEVSGFFKLAGAHRSRTYFDRSLVRRNNYTLIDKVNGNNASIIAPVSSFAGDGYVNTQDFVLNTFVIKFTITSNIFGRSSVLFGRSDTFFQGIHLISGNSLRLRRSDGTYFADTVFSEDDLGKEVKIIYDGNSVIISYDDIVQSTTLENGYVLRFNRIGSYDTAGGNLFQGTMHSINLNNELFIPLPHKGIGFNANGETIDFRNTPENPNNIVNVTEGYEKGGSLWMFDHGAVNRRPELVVNGDFSDGVNGWELLNNWVDGGGKATVTPGVASYMRQIDGNVFEDGRKYEVTYTILDYISGTVNAQIGGRSTGSVKSGNGTYTDVAIADGTRLYFGTSANANFSITKITSNLYNNYIPNKPDGTTAFPIEEGDELIPATPNGINGSEFLVDYLNTQPTNPVYSFFDKSNVNIYKDDVRASDWFDSDNLMRFKFPEEGVQSWWDINLKEAYQGKILAPGDGTHLTL